MKLLKIKKNRGFVILFAVTLSAIILSIALGVTNIAFREIKFSTSAKDSNDAFFAADAGIECAMLNDKTTSSVFISPSSSSITCNTSTVTPTENPTAYWKFIISGLGSGGQGCAIVIVNKTDSSGTRLISKGYNNDSNSPNCTPGLNTVERQIELNY